MTLNHREGRKALRHELKDSWAQLSNTLLCCLHYLKYEFLGKKEQGKLQILQIITDSKALLPNCFPLLLRWSRSVAGVRHLESGAGKAAFTITPENISSQRGKTEVLAGWRLCLSIEDVTLLSMLSATLKGPVTKGKSNAISAYSYNT